jgi:hypothetical protein
VKSWFNLWMGLVLLLNIKPTLAEYAEAGWIRSKQCLSGPGDSTTNQDTINIRKKLDWHGFDTLRPQGGLGSIHRLRVERNGQVLLRNQDFEILPGDSLLLFSSPIALQDSICIDRATTPLFIQPNVSLYQMDRVPIYRNQILDPSETPYGLSRASTEDTAYSKYRLNYSGSKSMAVSLGSGGGLGLDASLFINLEGQIAEDVFVEGQLSDQNVPIQPDGNTATLKEVDTKFMRVYGKHYSYTLGNYLMDYGVAGEDRYTAKVQGVNGAYSRGDYGFRGAWSISDGQYQSDSLRGVDGKQRGYYLRGRDGRQFITVLAGTERIWRNGQPLKRGIDYTIDYSEGRLDFLTPVVVTSENLFSAEFQYTDQEFQRSLALGEVKDSAGPLTWSVRSITELENKDQPLNLTLDSNSLQKFIAAGDTKIKDSLGRTLQMPRRQSSAAVDMSLKLTQFDGHGALLLSQLDRNLYSNRDDQDNYGYSTRYQGQHRIGKSLDQGGWGNTAISIEHEYRDSKYESFKQLIEPRGFLEIWNLNSTVAQNGFLANRVTVEERPFSKLLISGEIGRADARAAADTSSARVIEGSVSKRTSMGLRLGGEKRFVEASSEAKFARSPNRQDNYRQHGQLTFDAGGFTPTVMLTRNEWIAERPGQALARSIKQEPEFKIATLPFFGKVSLTSGLALLSQSGNFGGALPNSQDSVRDIGFTQKVDAIGIGPWNSDLFYSFQNHKLWRLGTDSEYSRIPEENNFNQVQWNNHLADFKKGYAFNSSYRVTQTAEFPLVDSFAYLPGRGNYVKDPYLNKYNPVQLGGDYVLVGLMRDTTVGSKPYQDLAWTGNLELVPAKFPFPVSGVLADIEFTLDLAMEHQDTTGALGLYPLFLDGQIEAARSGGSRYSPALHWKAPSSNKSLDFYGDRSFSLGAGIYAFKEKLWNGRSNFRHELNDDWEYALEQSYENRTRETVSTGTNAVSENQNFVYGFRLLRKLPKAFSLEGRGQYLTVSGNANSLPIDLQGIKPALKLEKGSLYNGRAFLEYGMVYFWGIGDGGYYTTGEYIRGLTHRMEANANFQIGENMYLNFDYLVRLEPGGRKVTQKLTAEARAVF